MPDLEPTEMLLLHNQQYPLLHHPQISWYHHFQQQHHHHNWLGVLINQSEGQKGRLGNPTITSLPQLTLDKISP